MRQIDLINKEFTRIKKEITTQDKKIASNTPMGECGKIYSISSINNCINGKSSNTQMSYDLIYFFKKRINDRSKKIKKLID